MATNTLYITSFVVKNEDKTLHNLLFYDDIQHEMLNICKRFLTNYFIIPTELTFGDKIHKLTVDWSLLSYNQKQALLYLKSLDFDLFNLENMRNFELIKTQNELFSDDFNAILTDKKWSKYTLNLLKSKINGQIHT